MSNPRTASQSLQDLVALLPPRETQYKNSRVLTTYRVLSRLNGRVLFTELEEDLHVDRASESIASFNRDLECGMLLPDGTVFHGQAKNNWRMSIIEYHGGHHITILENQNRSPYGPLSRKDLARLMSYIPDDAVRSEVIETFLDGSVSVPTTFEQYLETVHELHFRQNSRSHGVSRTPFLSYA